MFRRRGVEKIYVRRREERGERGTKFSQFCCNSDVEAVGWGNASAMHGVVGVWGGLGLHPDARGNRRDEM
jgi:hypothetical protein